MEKELIIINESQQECTGVLLIQLIKVYTNIKNLVWDNLSFESYWLMIRILLLEKCEIEIVHIAGERNMEANYISRYDVGPYYTMDTDMM